MPRALVLAAAPFAAPAASALPAHLPFGPQNDVAVAAVLGGGWSVIHSDLCSDTDVPLTTVFDGADDWLMPAARPVGAEVFDLLAGVEAAAFLPLQTAKNATVPTNGSEWCENGESMGFAPLGASIFQNTADTSVGDRRLSRHANLDFGSDAADPAVVLSCGWRTGVNTGPNEAEFGAAPARLPAGLALLAGAPAAPGPARARPRGRAGAQKSK